ncbi:hypothetical protein BIT28_20140 [Photobacterium proteolyticum]|uniref:Calcineurin-like phosphoesterase domain-containing protein n=1 Tax=Photobacterium proteolyticum TaxID=1903952 RepID=A0A1Q9GIA6_9GAMM|nr:metallophosphoesterase [Photobacterium proteolyticum]OLQ74183.1 hypothetical protein BIT28_20140 [Photobacterium proteolyticum]
MRPFIPRHFHQAITRNTAGTDFIVSDIHGQYRQLYRELAHCQFRPDRDRLFSTGDLISRGPQSPHCLELLLQPWFCPVLGNHEQLFLLGFSNQTFWDKLIDNGSSWLKAFLHQPQMLLRWQTLISLRMPLALTLSFAHQQIGISHATAPRDWNEVVKGQLSTEDVWRMLWNRSDINTGGKTSIRNIDLTLHGHNPSCKPVYRQNQCWLMSGVGNQSLVVKPIKYYTEHQSQSDFT